MLKEARNRYYYLTYIHPEQLYHLLDYAEDSEAAPNNALINTLKFVNPHFKPDMLVKFEIHVGHSKALEDGTYGDLFDTLCSLGQYLQNVFHSLSQSAIC
jgi:hypothetical protein